MQQWLIEESALAQVRRACECELTAPQVEALGRGRSAPERSILTVEDGTAQIDLLGVLTAQRDPWLGLFGVASTSYAEINRALGEAASDPSVERVRLWVDSPGGEVRGLFDTLAQLQTYPKPISSTVAMATSAAYAIAVAGGGRVTALGPASTVGSIGVAASFPLRNTVEVASTEAPNKRPDVQTPEGRAVVRAHLDDLHQLFAEGIAAGRGTTVERVNAEFGRGGLVLARKAMNLGMIDSVLNQPDRPERVSDVAEATRRTNNMTAEQLKTQHPEAYAAAVAEGVAQERDRVSAHLIRGEATGPKGLETAIEAIKSGEGMTQVLDARYFAAGINERDLQHRANDDAAAAHALDGAAAPPTPSGADAVAAELETLIGGVQ